MKKKFLTALLTAVAGCALLAGNAMADPWDGLDSSWVVSGNMDYWTPTDLTTSVTGTSMFEIELENAWFESSFGIYTVDASGNVNDSFEIFSLFEEPDTKEVITFWNDGGVFKVTDEYVGASTVWTPFDGVFGFYYDVYNVVRDANGNLMYDANGDPVAFYNYTFYTDNSLNTQDAGIEHIMTAYSEGDKSAFIYLEDLLDKDADWDWDDMTVYANDVQPVPEPATMLLFGAGLAGLAGVARRKGQKK